MEFARGIYLFDIQGFVYFTLLDPSTRDSLILLNDNILSATAILFYFPFLSYICIMTAKQTIWDPLRRKDVALTPEERVRQWFIGVLTTQMQVPMHMMMSEVGFGLGSKQLRADIVIYDRKAQPLAVVECKRPEVQLTQEVLDQAIRYNMVLNVKYIIITNGTRTYICGRQGEGYSFLDKAPVYQEML